MAASVRLKPILLPSEHGSWNFFLEPVLVALLLAPSWVGASLAVAAAALFLLRNPVRVVLRMRRRSGAQVRVRVAVRFAVAFGTAAAGVLALAAWRAGWPVLLPLAATLPFGAAFMWLDARNEGRSLAAELLGPVNLSAFAACIVMAGGWALRDAVVLYALVLGKEMLTVLYVRARLRLEHGQDAARVGVMVAHTFAFAAVALAWRDGAVPPHVLAAFLVLSIRAAEGLSPRRARLTVTQVGIVEIGMSAVFVACVVFGYASRAA